MDLGVFRREQLEAEIRRGGGALLRAFVQQGRVLSGGARRTGEWEGLMVERVCYGVAAACLAFGVVDFVGWLAGFW